MSAPWSIYYADGSRVDGKSRKEWVEAPRDGVQVVVVWEVPDRRPWVGVSDRVIQTGEDEYRLGNWPKKFGSLIPDADYDRIWRRAFYEAR